MGVDNFRSDSEKVDVIRYINDYYVHKQIEIRNHISEEVVKKWGGSFPAEFVAEIVSTD